MTTRDNTGAADIDVRRPADTRTAARVLAAVLLPVGPACVAFLRYLLPYFDADSAEESIKAIAAHPDTEYWVVWLGTLAFFTLVPAMYWVGRVTRRRAPRLTAAALLLAVPGYLSMGALVMTDGAAWYGVDQGHDTAVLADLFENGHPSIYVFAAVFVLGHVAGTVILGIALARARAVPMWAAVLVALSQPAHFVSFIVIGSPLLDGLSWAALAVGFAAVSVAVLRMPDDEWDLAPTPRGPTG
jgi:hypothetical protein